MAISTRRFQRAQGPTDTGSFAWLSGTPLPPVSIPPMTTGYRVSGTQIVDPSGQPFIPRGVNVGSIKANGGGWPDFSMNAQYATDFITRGGNTVRIPHYASTRYGWSAHNTGYTRPGGATFSGEDATFYYAKDLIDFWRTRGLVVIIDTHDFIQSGWTQQHLEQCETFWLRIANEYKTDTGVWFNLYNELSVYVSAEDGPLPSGNKNKVLERWTNVSARACKIIRDAGAPNIIICDGLSMAQDSGSQWDGKPAPYSYSPSAAPLLSSMYGGIVVGWHNYGALGNTAAKITTYINTVHGAGLPLVIGEFGYPIKRGWDDISSSWWPNLRDAFDWTMATVPPLGVGMIFWSSSFKDSFSLYKPFWDMTPSVTLINEFAASLPSGRSLSGQGVKFLAYLADGQAVPYSQSHSGGSAEE